MADNVAITAGSGTSVATDDVGGQHYQKMKLFDGTADSAAAIPGDATNGLDVDVTRVVPGTAATELGKAEDVAHASGDVGVLALAVRRDTPAVGSGTDGDNSTLNVNNAGRLYVAATVDAAIPAGTNNIGDVDVLTLPNVTLAAGTNTNEVVGDAAHDAATAGNPVLIGARASAAAPTDVSADNDVVTVWALRNGAQVVNVAAGGALITGDGTNGLDVDVTRLPALPAGNNNIGDVDVVSVVPGTGSTALGKAEDGAHTTGDVGVLALGVRRDADTSPVDADGDYHAPIFDNAGNLKVNIKAGAGSGGTAMTDDAAFTPGTTSVTPAAGTYRTTRDNLDDNDGGAIAITQKRAVLTSIETPAGDSAMDETNDALRVNVVAGSAGGPSKVDDAAFSVASDSVAPIGYMADETSPDSVNEGDVGIPRMSLNRVPFATLRDAAGNERGANVTAGNALVVDGSGVTQPVSGTVSINAIPAGANNIGDVDVLTLPAIPAGTNNIGDVDVLTLPAIPAGTNNIGDVDVLTTVTPADRTASGSLASTASVTVNPAQGTGSATVQITGTWTATVQFEGSTDGTNFYSVNAQPVLGGTFVTSATANGQWIIATAGFAQFRVRCSAYTSGTIVITIVCSHGSQVVSLGNAIPAGNNNIGDVDIASLPNEGQQTMANSISVAVASDQSAVATTPAGNVAHDGADSGNPIKIGHKAIAHGANPTAVAANDRTDWYSNRHGIPFVIGGHPNIVCTEFQIQDADGAQTNVSLTGTIGTGTKVVVTLIQVTLDAATTATGGVGVRIGFGASAVPTATQAGVNGVVMCHEGIPAGSGVIIGNGGGIIGVGADGEELRMTCEDPVGGNLTVIVHYYTIES